MNKTEAASLLQKLGAGGFGAIIGWYVYYVNRWRRGDVQLGDIVTLIGAIGGAAILTLFPKKTDLFGAYGVGLFAGFFAYFAFLLFFVGFSNFRIAWFLDGRRPKLGTDEMEGDTTRPQRPMETGRREET